VSSVDGLEKTSILRSPGGQNYGRACITMIRGEAMRMVRREAGEYIKRKSADGQDREQGEP